MKEKQDKEKREITVRFLAVIDHLMDNGRVKTLAELEDATGIRPQKITAMRSYLKGDSNTAQYPSITDIQVFREKFNVNYAYIFEGKTPIIAEKTETVSEPDRPDYAMKSNEIKLDLNYLKAKLDLISEKMDHQMTLFMKTLE